MDSAFDRNPAPFFQRRSFLPCLLLASIAAIALAGAGCSTNRPQKTAFERGIGPAALPVPMRSFNLQSTSVGDTLVIDVTLPPEYDAHPDRRYPVVYMTDAYWRRGDYGVIHALGAEGSAEPCIVVGVGYPAGYDFGKIRERDLVRHPEHFLASFAREIIPAIEKEYRADPSRRILWGASYGGFFTLVCVSLHDLSGELFHDYLCVSPMLVPRVDKFPDVMAALEALKARHPAMRGTLFLAVGGDEPPWMISSFETFDEFFRTAGLASLNFYSKSYPSETHHSVGVPALPDAIKLVLPPVVAKK